MNMDNRSFYQITCDLQVMSKPYPIKSHGKKTFILSYALDEVIEKFDLLVDVFDR